MPVTAALIGAGQRGFFVFGDYARRHPDAVQFVAVVEPDRSRRERFLEAHPAATPYEGLTEFIAAGRVADAAIVAGPDRAHHSAARSSLVAGYDVLLEKPMAATLAEAVDLVRVAADTGRQLAVAHVLRYTPFFTALHEVIGSGELGEVITVEHRENVWAFHMAHSFVRGNWAVAKDATPMIVQKCSHDFDILQWNLQSPVVKLSSMGSLLHFRPEKAPPGATPRCTDGCAVEQCPYDARMYLNPAWTSWPVHVLTDDLTERGRLAAIETGPWGRCVYTAGSDVVDNQLVTMQLESGASVVLAMHGHSADESRTMRYDGSRATLRAVFGRKQAIEVTDHASGVTRTVDVAVGGSGHGGGDDGVMTAFLEDVTSGATSLTSAAESLESHLLAFAAEEARLSGETIDMARFRENAESLGLPG